MSLLRDLSASSTDKRSMMLSSGWEDRYLTIGMVGDVIAVIYTARNSLDSSEEIIRLISARIATEIEKEEYYGNGIL